MKIYLGTDHAGFELKEKLKVYLEELGYEAQDLGPFSYVSSDDFPDYVKPVAEAVAKDKGSFGIIMCGSGQGAAMCANRVKGIRAGVYYGAAAKNQIDASGNSLDVITSLREHNDANVLSLGARFLTLDEAKEAVKIFLETKPSDEEKHLRRINKF